MELDINLLQNQKDYNRLDNYFKVGRIIVMVLGAVCLISLVLLFALKRQVQLSVNNAGDRQDQLLQQVDALEEREAQVVLIDTKVRSISSIVSETPDYSSQVETLYGFFPQASGEAQIETMLVDQNEATLRMNFPDSLVLSKFLQTIETESFQSFFKSIEVSSVQISDVSNSLFLTLNVGFQTAEDN